MLDSASWAELLCKEAQEDQDRSYSCYVCKKNIAFGEDYYYKLKGDGTYDTELCQRCATNQLQALGVIVPDVEVTLRHTLTTLHYINVQ